MAEQELHPRPHVGALALARLRWVVGGVARPQPGRRRSSTSRRLRRSLPSSSTSRRPGDHSHSSSTSRRPRQRSPRDDSVAGARRDADAGAPPTPTSPAAAARLRDNRAFSPGGRRHEVGPSYCAVLRPAWHVYNGTYAYRARRHARGRLPGPGTSWVTLVEGDLCGKGGMSMCTWHTLGVDQGPAAVRQPAAELWVRTLDPPYVAVGADYNSTHEYLVHTADVNGGRYPDYRGRHDRGPKALGRKAPSGGSPPVIFGHARLAARRRPNRVPTRPAAPGFGPSRTSATRTSRFEERVRRPPALHRGHYMDFGKNGLFAATDPSPPRHRRPPRRRRRGPARSEAAFSWSLNTGVPCGGAMLELPAGTLETHDGAVEDPLVAAIASSRRRPAYRAGTMERIGGFWSAPGSRPST